MVGARVNMLMNPRSRVEPSITVPGSASLLSMPKYRMDRASASRREWKQLAYRGPRSSLILLEAAFAVYFLTVVVLGVLDARYAAVPFLMLFAAGFSYVTLSAVSQELSRWYFSGTDRQAAKPAP